MGSPISGTIAKVFLHHLEEAHIKHLLNTNRITFYNRYADDILIIYDSTRTTYESILQYTNGIHNNMQLEPTTETNSRINYLYLLITRNPTKFGISIFRKPTSTDTTINFYSNNPLEHKLAAYRFHIERMFTLPLREAERQEEWESIKQIACNNNYPINLLQKLKQRIQWKLSHLTLLLKSSDTKLATFTSPKIRKITNIFKQTNVKIAYKTNNTILQLTRPTTNTPIPPHAYSEVYALTCNTCKQVYVGQTSQSLKLHYQEHIRYIKNNNPQLAYALHIPQNHHEYGPMNQTMHLPKSINSTSSLIPYERFYIQSLHQGKKLNPEQSPGDLNPCFNWSLTLTTPQLDRTSRTAPSALYTRPMQMLSRPPPFQKLGYVKTYLYTARKYFNHTTHPLPLSNLTTTLNTHNLRRDLITNTHNPKHLKLPPRTSSTHTPPTTRSA